MTECCVCGDLIENSHGWILIPTREPHCNACKKSLVDGKVEREQDFRKISDDN